MKLPNAEHAVIDPRKLTEYSLNALHDDGKHKAFLFQSLVGITADNPTQLLDALRRAAAQGDAKPGRTDRYGHRYAIDFDFSGPQGTVRIRSAWIIRTGELVPRLVTCYIIQGTEECLMGKRNPDLFDLVAVVTSPAGAGVEIGDVGTVVELLPPDAVEVEFIARDGHTRALATLQIDDVLVLNRERTEVA